jgi:hypothetical protein
LQIPSYIEWLCFRLYLPCLAQRQKDLTRDADQPSQNVPPGQNGHVGVSSIDYIQVSQNGRVQTSQASQNVQLGQNGHVQAGQNGHVGVSSNDYIQVSQNGRVQASQASQNVQLGQNGHSQISKFDIIRRFHGARYTQRYRKLNLAYSNSRGRIVMLYHLCPGIDSAGDSSINQAYQMMKHS